MPKSKQAKAKLCFVIIRALLLMMILLIFKLCVHMNFSINVLHVKKSDARWVVEFIKSIRENLLSLFCEIIIMTLYISMRLKVFDLCE